MLTKLTTCYLMDTLKSQYISTTELAKFLGISTVAVFKRIKSGQIKAIKIGRSYAIPRFYIDGEYKKPSDISVQYLSVMQVAAQMGISRIAVFKKIKSGDLPAKRIGRHYVINAQDIKSKIDSPEESNIQSKKEFLSVPELAKIMGISRVAVFKKIKQGHIKAKKVGRNYVISASDIKGEGSAQDISDTHSQEYISVIEASKILGINRIAVFKRIQKGQLKAIKVGRSYALKKSDVEQGKEKIK